MQPLLRFVLLAVELMCLAIDRDANITISLVAIFCNFLNSLQELNIVNQVIEQIVSGLFTDPNPETITQVLLIDMPTVK